MHLRGTTPLLAQYDETAANNIGNFQKYKNIKTVQLFKLKYRKEFWYITIVEVCKYQSLIIISKLIIIFYFSEKFFF